MTKNIKKITTVSDKSKRFSKREVGAEENVKEEPPKKERDDGEVELGEGEAKDRNDGEGDKEEERAEGNVGIKGGEGGERGEGFLREGFDYVGGDEEGEEVTKEEDP